MKKLMNYLLFSVLFSFIFCITIFAEPKVGDVVGNIYSTDIMAYVDGVPIQSYNIGGKTAIVLEDLREYGFEVEWRQDIRKLFVKSETYLQKEIEYPDTSQIVRGKTGEIVGKIYSTDIVAIVNGLEVPSYNIGGKTVVCIEDLGNIDTQDNQNKQFGYSKYAMYFIWNQPSRTIRLNTFKDNRYELEKICKQYNITVPVDCLTYKPNFKYIDKDDIYFQMPGSYNGSKAYLNRIEDYYKIILNGREIESDIPLILIIHISYGDALDNIYVNYNIDKLKNIFEEENLKNPFTPLTQEDVVEWINKDSHIKVLNKTTIDDFVYLIYISIGIMHGGTSALLKIDNNANVYTYPMYTFNIEENYLRAYYTDDKIIINDDTIISKTENEKTDIYYIDFNTNKVKQIYSDYNIKILDCYNDFELKTDIIKIQNSKGEAIKLKLNELLK